MKAASAELIAYLQNADQFLFADFFTFTLTNGTVLRYCDKDLSLMAAGFLYRADQVRVDGLRYKLSIGLDVDEQTISLAYAPEDLINGVSWGEALRTGLLDGAYLRRSRAFFSGWNQEPIGVIPLFSGRISTVDSVGRVEAQVKVKSMAVLLDVLMPRNTYQTGCIHSLFDVGCTLNRAAYGMNWSASGGSTNGFIVTPSASPPLSAPLAGNAEGLGLLVQGSLIFTAGVNTGVVRTIRSVSSSGPVGLSLSYPLEHAPAGGDTFTVWPGCDKTEATCLNRFHNKINFRGYPYTPTPETVY